MSANKLTLSAGDLTVDISARLGAEYFNANNSTNGNGLQAAATGSGQFAQGTQLSFPMDGFTVQPVSRVNALGYSSEKNAPALDFLGSTAVGTYNVDFAVQVKPTEAGVVLPKAYVSVASDYGTLKAGQDYGLYGSQARELDNTVGYVVGTTARGHVGAGRSSVPSKKLMVYTIPEMGGLSASVGITSPVAAGRVTDSQELANGGFRNNVIAPSELGLEAALSYDIGSYFPIPGFEAKIFASGLSQDVRSVFSGDNAGATTIINRTEFSTKATGFDYGTKISGMGFELAAVGFNANGLGVVDQLSGGISGIQAATGLTAASVGKRKSNGAMVQASYILPIVGTVLQGSWGNSRLQANENGADTVDTTGNRLDRNEMFTVGLRQDMTEDLNFKLEFAKSKARNVQARENVQQSVAFGAKWRF